MPYIDENHLVDLHKTIDSKEVTEKRLMNELRKQREEKDKISRKKDVFKWTSISLVIILMIGVTLYFTKPSVYINDAYLQSENKMLINKDKINNYDHQISMLATQLENTSQETNTIDYRNLNSEVIYAVQIAALENKDISLYSEDLRNINQYKDKPYNKYSLGNFTSLNDAKVFRKELITLGFQDAFVASYKDGKRLKIEDAL